MNSHGITTRSISGTSDRKCIMIVMVNEDNVVTNESYLNCNKHSNSMSDDEKYRCSTRYTDMARVVYVLSGVNERMTATMYSQMNISIRSAHAD